MPPLGSCSCHPPPLKVSPAETGQERSPLRPYGAEGPGGGGGGRSIFSAECSWLDRGLDFRAACSLCAPPQSSGQAQLLVLSFLPAFWGPLSSSLGPVPCVCACPPAWHSTSP